MSKKKIAILDLGTNTFHILIAQLRENDHFDIIFKKKFPVKLGQKGINEGFIQPAAWGRAIRAIGSIHGILIEYKTDELRAFATSAIRNAINGRPLLNEIKGILGTEPFIISGEEEAEYIYYGVRLAIEIGDNPSLIMDIGGGSVEFIICNQYQIFWKRSFEIGAQRLYDHFQQNDPLQRRDIDRINTYLDNILIPLREAVREYHPKQLIGCSGTFDTFSDIFCERYGINRDPELLERPINLAAFIDIHAEIIGKNITERMAIPGMSPMRADMICMSSLLIHYMVVNFSIHTLRASAYSLKEGILSLILDNDHINDLSA